QALVQVVENLREPCRLRRRHLEGQRRQRLVADVERVGGEMHRLVEVDVEIHVQIELARKSLLVAERLAEHLSLAQAWERGRRLTDTRETGDAGRDLLVRAEQEQRTADADAIADAQPTNLHRGAVDARAVPALE